MNDFMLNSIGIMKMFKDFFCHKNFIFVSQWIGVLFFSGILTHVFFSAFFLRTLPECSYISIESSYLECGKGLKAGILEVFFTVFSPQTLLAPIYQVYGLFVSSKPFDITIFLKAASGLLASVFIFAAIAMLYYGAKNAHLNSTAENRPSQKYNMMLLVMFLPLIFSGAYYFYMIPPKFLGKTIVVDFWHGKFSVPREYLESWSLVEPKKLEISSGVRGGAIS